MVYFILEIMFSVSDLCNTVCNNIIFMHFPIYNQLHCTTKFSCNVFSLGSNGSYVGYCHISLLRYFILSTIGQSG